ncbi:MAG: chaperone NapD [Sulfuricurvum sp.]
MNISSIVVKTLPTNLDQVLKDIKNSPVCDYHLHDEKGRIIITIESDSVAEELEKLKVIEAIPNVITAEMQQSYSEDELDRHIEVIANGDAVPKVLNDESIKASDIVYNGDLKKQDDLASFARSFDQKKR